MTYCNYTYPLSQQDCELMLKAPDFAYMKSRSQLEFLQEDFSLMRSALNQIKESLTDANMINNNLIEIVSLSMLMSTTRNQLDALREEFEALHELRKAK